MPDILSVMLLVSQALDVNRFDAWAAHAVSHCKEMTGKYEEGIKFMGETENNWSVSIL